ncbi:MAG: hypothetical protein U1C74_20245, partial [Phenylobacterium sp.]|nr:hypothetical protein [Phenylobacterium sp.]
MRPSSARGLIAAILAATLAGCAANPTPTPQARGGGAQAYVDVGLAGQASPFEAYTRRTSAITP